MKLSYKIGLATTAVALAGGIATSAAAAQTSPHPAEDSVARPSVSSVGFSGYYGTGVSSPTITIDGSGFGGAAPAGASDDNNSCGGYTDNGSVFLDQLYFLDDSNFEAGYSNVEGADCLGIKVVSWSDTQVVLQFGSAYASWARWYLENGDGYAISIEGSLYGGTVSGLI
jgi:hypothetical protein